MEAQNAPRYLNAATVCTNKDTSPRAEMRDGDYWVLTNYVKAAAKFHCNESITYTTHCDHTFLDNLEPLLVRWQGPISVAIYAPGTDYKRALDAIFYYRSCTKTNLVFKVYADTI